MASVTRRMPLARPLRRRLAVWVGVALAALAGSGWAATSTSTEAGIATYRAMLADDNPAELFEARGQALWQQPRGPKQANLQACDLGLGPGVVAGAWAQLPRWFADTGRVQDLESRLLTCMAQWQGLDAAQIAATPFGQGEQRTLEALVAWVASQSRGQPLQVPQAHPAERQMYALGQRLFNFRAGPMDLACATCHGAPGRRIRLQELPDLRGNPGDGVGFAAWPAYRLSSGELWSLQRRLNDCFRQQRFPYPGYASDATVALGVYMGVNAKGALAAAPSLKR
jgi:sulfur-oxidizing protein SoxA